MANSINTNISAYYAQANLSKASSKTESSIARLSSGNRIVKASDDVAALSIGTTLASRVNTLKQGLVNAKQANSFLEVADGALANLTEILQRQLSIATQANSGTLSGTERGFLDQEFQSLTDEIDRLVNNTKFNSVVLLDGSLQGGGTYNSVAGANSSQVLGMIGNANAVVNGFNALGTVGQNFYGDIKVASVAVSTANASNYDITLNIGGVVWTATDVANNATTFTVTTSNSSFNGANIVFQNFSGAGSNFPGAANLPEVLESRLQTMLNSSSLLPNYQMTGFLGTGNMVQVYSNTVLFAGVLPGKVGTFSVDGVPTAANNGRMSVDIGGIRYTTSTVPNTVANTSTITFNSTVDNTQLRITLTGLNGNYNYANAVGASDFASALNDAFSGVTTNGKDFQVGLTSTDVINVTLGDARTSNLYGGFILDVQTQAAAQTSVTQLNEAIEEVTALRANVGALESRFNYAANVTETSIQNQDAAKSVFLDTDVAAESSAFAQQQVLMQASISVLAQANLMPQNLLKLIG